MGSSTSSASSSTREEGDVTTGRGGDAPTVGRLARITRRKMSRTGHGSSSVQSSSCLKTVSNVEAATEQHKEEEEEAEGGKKRVVQTRSKNESIVESVCLFCLFVFFSRKGVFVCTGTKEVRRIVVLAQTEKQMTENMWNRQNGHISTVRNET